MSVPPLLRGLALPAAATPAGRRAAAILRGLGAGRRADGTRRGEPAGPATPEAGPADALPAEALPGLPAGVAERAQALALAAATVDGALRGRPVAVSEAGVLAQLYLPAVIAASYGAPPARHCPEPMPVGDGAVQADLGAEGAAEAFETLLATLSPAEREDPERLAAAAQLWRLPVLPYRGADRGVRGEVTVAARAGAPPASRPAADGVLDLTAMWAGPLATWLLAAGGARVWKVESRVRLDGMRALDGRGIHPPGAAPDDGEASGMFNALNRGKRRLDLDLREPEARRRLLDRAGECDLVVENFSPRVLGNLRIGYEVLASAAPGITVLSLPALPPGTPEADWVAYGAGVHAIGGMGGTAGGFRAPAFAYPDVLAGLHAHLLALAVRFGRARGNWHGGHLIAPMSAALPPVAPDRQGAFVVGSAYRYQRRTQSADDADRMGARLPARGDADFVTVADGAGTHRYPRSPFRTGPTVAEAPAPALNSTVAHG